MTDEPTTTAATVCPKCRSTDLEPRNPTIRLAPLGKAWKCRNCGRRVEVKS